MTSAEPCVQIQDVGKTYASPRGDVRALENVTLNIAEGEFVSIVGPSGCGKSTLLKCVAGLEDVTEGTIAIRSQRVAGPPDDIGIVFQRDVLLDWRTVLDNVLLPVEFQGLKIAEWRGRALELLRMLDLEQFAGRYPWELSGGMRQRAAICRGLLLDPSLLLMDEPFGALDAITRDELNLQLESLWERTQKTVLFITHSITESVFLSSRVVIMGRDPGRIAAVIPIDLPRPRTLAVRESAEFGRYAGRIREVFESLGIMGRGKM